MLSDRVPGERPIQKGIVYEAQQPRQLNSLATNTIDRYSLFVDLVDELCFQRFAL